MFKKKLGDSRKEATAAWPKVHAEIERTIAEAVRRRALASGLSLSNLTDRDAYAKALRRRADLIAAGASEEELRPRGRQHRRELPSERSV